MAKVPFTQFLLPDGRRRETSLEVDEETGEKARKLIDKNYRFECEILTTGDVSFTCEGEDEEDGPISIEFSKNGPEVYGAVKKVIETAYHRLAMDAQ